ncbi:SPOR domain-containing protein [Pseudoalteromonas sp. SCSIO 43095]|uniref:AAA family ATPase n=1 Tax=Pseudoalteromonas TaxID=53246 RepID=UPI0008499735|nr:MULTISPECIES: AAA family ATPase [Pseudoalteromonas]MCK8133899.1 SPOR domain-containing protein [Pseudoalteromonas sp. 2CM28B]MDX1359799.1 SPOR domain-containing protein [Pseudoalteromonas tetraodonis]MDX1726881.1 SPOR domain-containing protein [Pseudoalteromonas tetraodonis]ODS15303.1 cell division protein DamX [Pseudoalteromonas tetraodonis]TMO26595.1 cell division protein DamX [Pseudoalteromonas sp. S4741]
MQSQILPSRAALVDRIALQFEYGQNLIVLLGTSGLGKSYLLETFITDKYNDFNKAFVQVGAQMTDVQLMTQLLEQSFNGPLIDHNLSLSQNYYQLAKQQQCGACLWVIDGGRHLSDELIAELELLSKSAPNVLYIMIASQSKLPFKEAVNIHLEPLNLVESKQLMGWYFTALPYDEDPVFKTFLVEAQGNPSLLLAWQPSEQVADIIVKDKVSWRLQLLTLLLIIMLLIIGVVYKADMTQWWKNANSQSDEQVLTTAITTEQAIQNKQQPAKSPTLFTSPQPITKEPTTDERAHNDVPAIVGSLTEPSTLTEQEKPAPPPVEEVISVPEVVKQQSQMVKIPSNWYLEQPEDNFVIQLLAVTQQQVSNEFIAEHKLESITNTYQTKRNGKMWWVVTTGSFANLNEAKQALQALPAGVRKNKPFYKKISKIKQEIARVDQ